MGMGVMVVCCLILLDRELLNKSTVLGKLGGVGVIEVCWLTLLHHEPLINQNLSRLGAGVVTSLPGSAWYWQTAGAAKKS